MQHEIVNAIIEIPLNSNNKYEYDEKTGRIQLDRVLYSAMKYPTEYGFIEGTLAPDGDPLDILVVSNEPTFPGCGVPARILGYLAVIDNGQSDYKLISVVACDPRFDNIHQLSDLSPFLLREIQNFFENYKTLQEIEVDVGDYYGHDEACLLIKQCRENFEKAKAAEKKASEPDK